ncbi:MAG TPA: hypothetical protein VF838_01190 [Trebonia sp.]
MAKGKHYTPEFKEQDAKMVVGLDGISGPGAGTQLAGQGVLADIIAVAGRPQGGRYQTLASSS